MSRTLLATGRLAVAIAFGALPCPVLAQPCDKPTECRQNTREADNVSLELRLRWRAIGAVALDAAGRLQFPEVAAEPGIYRFELRRKDDRALYVGETDNLKRRFYQYRNPGKRQPTNHRICVEIRQTLASGGNVNVSIGDDAWFCAREGCARADLASANQRRLLEQLAIFSGASGARILNSERNKALGASAVSQMFLFCS